MKIKIILICLLSISFTPVYADGCESNVTQTDANFHFKETLKAAKVLANELCFLKTAPTDSNSWSIKIKAGLWRKAALEDTKELKQANIDLTNIIEELYSAYVNTEKALNIYARPYKKEDSAQDANIYKKFKLNKNKLTYRTTDGKLFKFKNNNDKCLGLKFKTNCYKVLDQFRIAANTPTSSLDKIERDKVLTTIDLYSKEWGDYFTKARSQTFIELGMNTWLYRNEVNKNEFVKPPSYQLILFHPSVAIEYVSDAIDGEQQKGVLMMEWFGINWWNWDVPLGVSFISSYTDRSSVDDDGYGAMIHLYNNYSIGYTNRGGVKGVIFTVDLLKLFEDKKSNLDNYKSSIKKYIN